MARRNARYTPLDVDGPLPLDMLRAYAASGATRWPSCTQCVHRYGDLVAFPLPGTPVLLVNDPDGARRVLLERHAGYGKATVQYTSLSLVTGIGLSDRRAGRMEAAPGGRPAGLPAHRAARRRGLGRPRRLRAAPRLGRGPGSHASTPSRQCCGPCSTSSPTPCSTPTSRRWRPGEHLGRRLVEAVDEALQIVIARARLPLPALLARVFPPARRAQARLEAANAVLDDACARIVADRRARGVGEGDADLLALLLRAARAGVLTEREVRDELVTMVIAGHETVASALTWALHLLATHPSAQDRLAEELDGVLGAADDARPTWEDLAGLEYTRAVLDEALRLYPPAWVITRKALADDVVAGVAVPAGTLMIISPWLLHRREAAWPDPERFDPGRFLAAPGRKSAASRPSGDYLPFGLGPRLCIGRDVALVEGVMVLAGLLRGRRVLPAVGHPGVSDVPLDALVTLRPHGGMPLRVIEREVR